MARQVTKRVQSCDNCSTDLLLVCYDTKTIYGPWANLCQFCYKEIGLGRLGTGLGQMYERKAVTDIFIKTAG